jgi:hypothetical protein
LLPISPTWRPVGLPTCWTPPHVSSGFRPRGFSPPRRLAPAPALGVLQPNRTRFAAFQQNVTPTRDPDTPSRSSGCPGPPSWPTMCVPNSATPLEEYHSPVAVPHHCGRCPLAVSVSPAPVSTSRRCGAVSPRSLRSEDLQEDGHPRCAEPVSRLDAPTRPKPDVSRASRGWWLDGSPGPVLLLAEDQSTSEDALRDPNPHCRSSRVRTYDAAAEPKLHTIAACPVTSRLASRTRRSALRRCPRPLGPHPTPKRRPRSRSWIANKPEDLPESRSASDCSAPRSRLLHDPCLDCSPRAVQPSRPSRGLVSRVGPRRSLNTNAPAHLATVASG